MKEQMTYVAIDADNVGESIGNAVLSNDTDKISSISNNINSGVAIFSQWANYNGGKVISSGSDEAIFQVPVQSLDDLEKLKQEYQDKTGFSISIGIGENVSDAAKALIYAKMNGKDQIMDYSPEMERAMKESLSGELNEQVEEDEDQLEGGVGDDTDKESLPQDELEEGTEHEKEHTDDEEIAEEIATDHLTEDDDYYSDLEEMEEEDEEEGEETEEIEVPADQVDGDYGSEEMKEAQPEHEKEMSEEEEFIHDAEENREDELDEDVIEADMEDELSDEAKDEIGEIAEEDMEEEGEEEALDEMLEEDDIGQEDIDLDGRPDIEEEHGEINPEEDDIDGDGDVEHEEAMAVEAGQEDEYDDTEDYEDEVYEDSEDLEDAISQEMGVEEEMEEAPVEEPGAEEPIDQEELKGVIYESLNIFKENREYLNAMAQENPQLYTSLIHTLQAMIEMAKELGYGDAAEEFEGQDPSMMEEQSFAEEEMEDGFEKTESFHSLIDKMRKAFEMFKSDPQTMEEVKEAIKKKKEQSKKSDKKSPSKKKKAVVKKPKVIGKKKKKVEEKSDNDGSFCAKSHKKMRAAGKDCRSNEDKNSPLCSARKKFNCRGKNEEKGPAMDKSEGTGLNEKYGPMGSEKRSIRHGDTSTREEDKGVEARKEYTGEERRSKKRVREGENKGNQHQYRDRDGDKSDRRKVKGTAKDRKVTPIKERRENNFPNERNKRYGDKVEKTEESKEGTIADRKKYEGKEKRKKVRERQNGEKKGIKGANQFIEEGNAAKETSDVFRYARAKHGVERANNVGQQKNRRINKSEKLAKFLKKKEAKLIQSGNKGRQATSTKLTGTYSNKEHVPKPQHKVGAQVGLKIVQEDPETGKKIMTSMPAGGAKGPDGNILPAEHTSPVKGKKPKPSKVPKTDKV